VLYRCATAGNAPQTLDFTVVGAGLVGPAASKESILRTDRGTDQWGVAPALASMALCSGLLILPAAAHADPAAGEWQWRATIYAWLPSVDGESSFPSDGGGSSIDVSGSDILNALDLAAMGSLEAHKGRWGFGTDIIYLDLGASKNKTRSLSVGGYELPAGVTADLDLNLTGWLWTLGGSYRPIDESRRSLDLFAGARLLNLTETLDWQFDGNIGSLPLPGRSGRSKASINVWDGIVAARGRAILGDKEKWFVSGHLDVGAGESDLTWQAMLGVGYKFGWGEISGLWRYLDYNFDSRRTIRGLTLNGPAIAVSVRF
jgi:hypothetical protein